MTRNETCWCLKMGRVAIIRCSQVAIGKENGLTFFIGGETEVSSGIRKILRLFALAERLPTEIYRTGNGYLSDVAKAATPVAGHPEGYLESFANLYKNFAKALMFYFAGKIPAKIDFPSIDDGFEVSFLSRGLFSAVSQVAALSD